MVRLAGKLGNVEFDVLDSSKFHLNEPDFIKYVNQFDPTVILLAFCNSKFCDIFNILVGNAVLAKMTIKNDFFTITGKNLVPFDNTQQSNFG